MEFEEEKEKPQEEAKAAATGPTPWTRVKSKKQRRESLTKAMTRTEVASTTAVDPDSYVCPLSLLPVLKAHMYHTCTDLVTL